MLLTLNWVRIEIIPSHQTCYFNALLMKWQLKDLRRVLHAVTLTSGLIFSDCWQNELAVIRLRFKIYIIHYTVVFWFGFGWEEQVGTTEKRIFILVFQETQKIKIQLFKWWNSYGIWWRFTIFMSAIFSLFPLERLEAVFFFFLPTSMLQHSHLPENVRMFIPRIKMWACVRLPK